MDKTELRDDIRIKTPDIHPTAFIADGAKVIGDVILNRNSSISVSYTHLTLPTILLV